ncbi:hypothetical protein [Candidatus Entotheonella palauensis]|uniref:hypothetical protein n=1 Tax=Candidatus Entotheonella palauensis TaxID=93172 RepID=UPI000B7CA9CC|nr:hypothetical protein [Candidatus Entotheonella palauensis]
MISATSLPDLLYTLNQGGASDEAYTLNRRIQITATLVDGQFVAATEKAARIYQRSIEEMTRTWQSLTQPLAEYRRSREICMARHYRHDMPTKYITRIVSPSGEVIPVVKETVELSIDSTSHWLTRIRLASEAPDLPDAYAIPIPAHPTSYLEFGGRHCLNEVQSMLQILDQENNVLRDGKFLSKIVNQLLNEDKENFVVGSKTARNGQPLTFGTPVMTLPNGQRILECQTCGRVWTRAKKGLPDRCAHPGNRCYDWRKPIEGSARQETSS